MDIKTVTGLKSPYGKDKIGGSESAESAAAAKAKAAEAAVSGKDRVTLSDDVKMVAEAAKAAEAAPAVRTDKVASLKAQVDAGTYQPDSKKIAEKLLTMEREIFG